MYVSHGLYLWLQVTKTKSDSDRTVRFNDLEAGTVYVVQAVTRSGSKTSDPLSITITTGKCDKVNILDKEMLRKAFPSARTSKVTKGGFFI